MELTDREKRILELLSQGKSNFEVSLDLAISKITFDKCLYGLKEKFKAKNTKNLIYEAAKLNII